MNSHWWYIICIAAIALTAGGCSSTEEKPRSVGDPYHLLLMAENDTARSLIAHILSTPMERLPQEEPLFSVRETDNDWLTHATKYHHTIIIVETDTARYPKTKVVYEHDAFARQQLITYICAPSAAALISDSARLSRSLLSLIDQAQQALLRQQTASRHNSKAEALADSLLGCHIDIPAELAATKTGNDFLWCSDNGNDALCNICVYQTEGRADTPASIIRTRDSILSANIPGETPDMRMTTERSIEPLFRRTRSADGRHTITETRGLWQMEGDAMGGPFVSLTTYDAPSNRTITAEAFVYAPGKRKRDMLKRLEASIATLRINTTKTTH